MISTYSQNNLNEFFHHIDQIAGIEGNTAPEKEVVEVTDQMIDFDRLRPKLIDQITGIEGNTAPDKEVIEVTDQIIDFDRLRSNYLNGKQTFGSPHAPHSLTIAGAKKLTLTQVAQGREEAKRTRTRTEYAATKIFSHPRCLGGDDEPKPEPQPKPDLMQTDEENEAQQENSNKIDNLIQLLEGSKNALTKVAQDSEEATNLRTEIASHNKELADIQPKVTDRRQRDDSDRQSARLHFFDRTGI